MLTRSLIEKEERHSQHHLQRINETFKRRQQSEAAWQEWESACHVWHQETVSCFYLWNQEAKKRMQLGEREVIEDALLFLEVDPWFFRSGYLKERVLQHLKSALLTSRDQARLRNIIDRATQGKNRREFRHYCRLALRVWTPEWEEELVARAKHIQSDAKHNSETGYKLTYLLRFLASHRYLLEARK